MLRTIALSFCLLIGCAGSPARNSQAPSPSSSEPASPRQAEAVASPTPAAAPLTAAALHGVWAEYWSTAGDADTRRYVFLSDGRFGWLAPERTTPAVQPLRRSGTYRIETVDGASMLVIETRSERFAACTGGCANAGEARQVEHDAPLVERYEIGECPPNQEAQRLDASYECRSFGGRAFWRRSSAPDAEASAFFR